MLSQFMCHTRHVKLFNNINYKMLSETKTNIPSPLRMIVFLLYDGL